MPAKNPAPKTTAKKTAAPRAASAAKPAQKATKPAQTASKSAAAKKPSTGRGSAKSSTAKATPAKASTVKASTTKAAAAKKQAKPTPKTAAAKAPAKKAAAAKTPSKSTARKSPAPRKATAAKSVAPATSLTLPAESGAAKGKVPFKVGDKVVYPHHGAATIIRKERQEFAGEKHDYFVLEVATDQLTVRVPTTKALELGVRPVISKAVARKVFSTFKDDPQEAGSNWSRWYKLLTEKINSGDIFQVAEVVRDLTYAQQVKGISPALKRMLAKARVIIISELRFALGLEEEEAVKRLDRALPKVDEPIEG